MHGVSVGTKCKLAFFVKTNLFESFVTSRRQRSLFPQPLERFRGCYELFRVPSLLIRVPPQRRSFIRPRQPVRIEIRATVRRQLESEQS